MTDFKGSASREGVTLTSGVKRITVDEIPHDDPEHGDLWFDTTDSAEFTNPGVGLQLNDDLDVADGVEVPVPWENKRWDSTGLMHSLSDPTRAVCLRPGVYDIVASLRFSGPYNGNFLAWMRVNGTSYRRAVDGAAREFQLVAKTALAEGDYLEILVQQNTGGLQQLISGARTALTVTWWGSILEGSE